MDYIFADKSFGLVFVFLVFNAISIRKFRYYISR